MPAEVKDAKLREIIAALPGAMRHAVISIGEEAASIAQQLVRKDTGSLAATIGIDPESVAYDGSTAHVVVCAGDTSGGYSGRGTRSDGAVDYAQVQEFGGAHTPPQPFMGPAAQHVFQTSGPRTAEILRAVFR